MGHGQVPEFLKESLKFGINLGLERMEELDRILGNPEDGLKAVHIAGTNGKGSTASFICACLAEAGYKVGIYTSPYLERFSERMRIINGKEGLDRSLTDEEEGEISTEDLDRLAERVKAASDDMTSRGFEHPTEFELMTALCFLWFKENDVDIAVLETGLGGRLDSTNVISKPLVTVITSIGFDHQDRLGDTIEQITAEKAGIFKEGVPVFAADPAIMLLDETSKEKVKSTLLTEAKRKNAYPVKFAGDPECEVRFTDDGRMLFEAGGEEYQTVLQGRHQAYNASVAIAVLKDVFGLSYETIRAGIDKTRWKGRAEILSSDPAVIIDGGHNVQCAQSLMSVLRQMCGARFSDLRFRVVIGVMSDKNVEGMIRTFKEAGLDPVQVYAVNVDNPRSMSPDSLSKLIRFVYNDLIMPMSFDSAEDAVSEACRKTREDGIPLLVTGSLYLIGEVRGKLCTIINNWR